MKELRTNIPNKLHSPSSIVPLNTKNIHFLFVDNLAWCSSEVLNIKNKKLKKY